MAETTKDKRVALVIDRFNEAESARQPLEEIWFQCYRLYRSYKEELPEDEQDLANIFVPKIFADIESIVPRVVLALFARRPWVSIKPREQEDVQRAKLASKLIQAQYDKQSMFVRSSNWIKQALIYGTSPAQIGWRERKRVGKARVFLPRIVGGQDLTAQFGPVASEEEKVYTDWDDPYFEPLDVWDFYPDPDGKSLSEMGWVIRREWASRADMEAAKVYDNISEAARTASEQEGDRPMDRRLGSVGLGSGRSGVSRTRPIELLHMWQDDRVVVVANRAVVVRDEPNPFYHGRKPFVAIVDTPVPNEFWGIGTAQVMKDLQEELNSIRNQRRDNVSLAVQRMFIAARNAGINPQDLRWRPGGVVWVDAIDDPNKIIRPIEVPEVTASSFNEEQQVHKDMEETNAVSDFFRGSLAESQRTATEISQAAQGGNARMQMKVMLIAEMGLKEITRQFLDLNRQFLTEERVVRLVGQRGRDEWISVSPGDLQFPYDDLIPAASNVEGWANKLQEREDLLRFLQIMGRAPMFAQMLDWRRLLERILQTYDFAEVEDFLVPEQQAQAIQQMLAQNMAGQVGMASGNQANAAMQEMMQDAAPQGVQ